MSKKIGSVPILSAMPRDVEVIDSPDVTVYFSSGGVELLAEPCTLSPEAAFDLAGLIARAADEAKKLQARRQSEPESEEQ